MRRGRRAGWRVATVTLLTAAATSSAASAGATEPLEIVALDVSAFPAVVLDVALPDWESAGHVGPDAFTVVGATGLVVERLAPADLTVALVLDNGPQATAETVATHQGSALELVRNLPDGVEVMICTASGVVVSPTADRETAMQAISELGPVQSVDPAGSLGAAVLAAAIGLDTATDPRRQLIVLTDDAADLTTLEAGTVTGLLDRSRAAMRVVAAGDTTGPNVADAARRSGGVAVPIGRGSGAVLRSVDVLTTSLTDQYRLTATMTAPGPLLVRLTVEDRVYETVIPDVGPGTVPAAPPGAAPATAAATAPPTTSSTTPPTSLAPQRTPVVTAADAERTSPPRREPSAVAGVEAAFGVAAIALVVVVVRQQRQRRRRTTRPASGRPAGHRSRR